MRTELRLVLTHAGWEYCVLKRSLSPAPAPDSNMLVTAIEFEGRPEEAIFRTLNFRVSLIAYPIVALRKVRARLFVRARARRLWECVFFGGGLRRRRRRARQRLQRKGLHHSAKG